MAASGYTPVYLYYSDTAASTPSSGNLGNGELAINITDGYLFYKDNLGSVEKIGYKLVPVSAGGTGLTSFTANGVLYAPTTTSLATSTNLTYNTDLALTGGNFKVSTAGKGIDFSATSGTGTSELLSDYEEGNWTPAVTGTTSAGTATYSVQNGIYTKIGNIVHVEAYISYTGHTGTGNMSITGLPFTAVASLVPPISIMPSNLALTASNIANGYVEGASARILITQTPTGGGSYTSVPMDTAALLFISANYTT